MWKLNFIFTNKKTKTIHTMIENGTTVLIYGLTKEKNGDYISCQSAESKSKWEVCEKVTKLKEMLTNVVNFLKD